VPAGALTIASGQEKDAVGIEYLGHAGVGMTDLHRALHFCCDQLGLTEAFRTRKAGNPPRGATGIPAVGTALRRESVRRWEKI
jgi:hypothetical protein